MKRKTIKIAILFKNLKVLMIRVRLKVLKNMVILMEGFVARRNILKKFANNYLKKSKKNNLTTKVFAKNMA